MATHPARAAEPGSAPGSAAYPLEVSGLEVTFPSEAGPVRAVRGLGYRLAKGEVLGIVGESGSGKSVSALAVLGLLPDSAVVAGSVRLHGRELLGLPDKEMSRIRGRSLAMVFQDPLSALTPVYSIGAQIVEAIRIHHPDVSKERARGRSVELLDLVGIPAPARRVDAFPHEFSGGMRQRAMIAMAIANEPEVIIADEPTTALDVTIQAQILDVLKTAREATGAAIVMITHDLGVVAGLADRVMVMYAGRPVETGVVEEIYHEPRMPYTIGLLGSVPRIDETVRRTLTPIEGNPPALDRLPDGCPFLPRCPVSVDRCADREPELIAVTASGRLAACHRAGELASGRLAPESVFASSAAPAPRETPPPRDERAPVIEVTGLYRHFPLVSGAILKRRVGVVRAVDGVTFDIRAGETLGLVGESGCGKTTTLLQLLDLTAPQQGSVAVFGRPVTELRGGDRLALRRDMQVVFQDPMAALDPRMPVGAILAEPLRTHGWTNERIRERVTELLGLVGLEPSHASRFPAEFSGGQRQRIGIARALALEPRLIVLDEPVSALDVSIQAGVINLLDELRARLGLSYLFVAHDLSVVRHIADRVAVMYLGRIVEIGETGRIFAAPSHPYTQALLSAIPIPDPRKERARRRVLLEGDLPSPTDVPSGCRFRTRCPKFATLDAAEAARCVAEEPEMTTLGADHRAACHYAAALDVV